MHESCILALPVPLSHCSRWATVATENIGKADCVLEGENSFLDWAKIVDCGDAPLTLLVI